MIPKIGEKVIFRNYGEVLIGIVNGAAFVDPESRTNYVPVHVQDGNKNIYVNEKNILEEEAK